jgi:hypothetical protein
MKSFLSSLLVLVSATTFAGVVINEIHCDSDPNPLHSEFIELFNDGSQPVDVSGWRFTDGIDYTIPAGTVIPPGGYLVVSEDLKGFHQAFGPSKQAEVIAHWSFDETTGDTAADSSGMPNVVGDPKTAVASGGVNQNVEGKFGGSGVGIDGVSGSYLTIPHLDALWSGSYTIAAWVRPADRSSNPILADNLAPQAFLFSVDTAAKMSHRFAAATPTTTPVWNGSGGVVSSNAWQHVAAVWDRESQVGRIYVNGELVYKGIVGKMPTELKMVENTRPWHIGRNQLNNESFNGLMDELWVIRGALPGASIMTLMNENRLAATEVVDLADVVGGGDGSRPGVPADRGIDAASGLEVSGPGAGDHAPNAPGEYYPVAHPLIDGVFVPNGTLVDGQVITSTGVKAALKSGDGDPSPGFWVNGGGLIGDPSKVNNSGGYYLPRYLEETLTHSLLSGMAQKGITFDLDAIEASRGGRQVTAFTAVAAESRMQAGGKLTALVLVDGTEMFRHTNIAGNEQVIDLSIPRDARFLTLVIGNSDNNNANDHGFFADPFLHLEPSSGAGTPLPVVGPYLGALASEGELVTLRNTAGVVMDEVEYRTEFPWPIAAAGEGSSMELQHPRLDNQLAGSWRSSLGAPTPGLRNSVFTENAPPQIRQVEHLPKVPAAQQPLTITAKITDPQTVGKVELHYQIVLPGSYISSHLALTPAQVTANPSAPRTPNPLFEATTNWVTVAMVDTGAAGDAFAGDSVFTAIVPGQVNRALVRYRITATDGLGSAVRVPYADDPALNFAAYVYNGIPDYVAATRSVTGTPGYVHSKEVMSSVPAYSLITDANDLIKCMAYNGSDQIPSDNFESREAFNWNGTFVYNGEVYDHIRYRLRQRNDRYGGAGKRSFRFRFNRGHYAQFHDVEGAPYPEKWRTLNSHKMSARGGPNLGLHEVANSYLWRIFGVPSPGAHWFHFRVVDGPEEAPSGVNGQHLGDFFGLMLGLEDYDSRFLSARNLPAGNIYKLNSYILNGKEVQRYQAPDSVTDGSDFYNILYNLRPQRTTDWLNAHVDFPAWYRYHAVVDAVRHYDVAPNTGEHLKNRAWYFRPDGETPFGKLITLPWDSDTSWGPNWNGGEDFTKAAVITSNKPEFVRDYRNVVREFRDLVWQRDQIEPMLDRFQVMIAPFQLADRDRWTGAPAAAGSQSDPAFATKVADMKKFAFIGGSWEGGDDPSETASKDSGLSGQQGRDAYLDWLQTDAAIPATPVVNYSGASGYPANGLAFTSSAFADPQGGETFGAMEWRLAEYQPNVIQPDDEPIIAAKSTWKFDDRGVDRGTEWRQPGYDDSGWGVGNGDFGYGEAGLGTTNSFGPSTSNRHLTYYYRKQFNVTEPERFTGFRLGVRRDDGAVVYLNGQEVFRTGLPAAPAPILFTTRASSDQSGANETTYFPFVLPISALAVGANTIAVEVHQFSTNNSDMRFDLTLGGIYPVPLVPSELAWEYEHRWKSPVITTFDPAISIPASAARENRHYRVRVRHQDNTGRWSHWSAPVEFLTTPPSIQPLLDHLVVSEIMYDPAPETPAEALAGWGSQDFEYIELANLSSSLTLDLTDVRFTRGVEVDIAAGTRLGPGAYGLVVRSKSAFELRYGKGLPVVGEFSSSRLDSGGEPLKLAYGGGVPLREFRYDDEAPWPLGANGTGLSISYPTGSGPLEQGEGLRWRVGPATPGQSNVFPQDWASWLRNYFDPGDPTYAVTSAPDADADADGQSNILEYILGSAPNVASSKGVVLAGTVEHEGARYFTLSFLQRPGVTVSIDTSSDLTAWSLESLLEVAPHLVLPDGSTAITLREAVPLGAHGRTRFFRIRARF